MSAAEGDYILTMSRIEQERKGKIRCHPSGRYVNPLAMTPDDIDIRDVAHHLSLICRYTGACPRHYSVGQHSVLTSIAARNVPPPPGISLALWRFAHLMHDGGEYVFNDLASPVKHDPRMAWYCEAEHAFTLQIFDKYGIPRELLALTKPLDDELFRREAATWWGGGKSVYPWRPQDTENRFLNHFHELYTEIHG